ncbi:DUF998 domain-containing protein [Methanospirillum hungatei]|uniref:DUF998 domain-containing protein n=1 Tax=Methanospirillum hungatei TaxID=2203 RepID=UPI0026EE903E|nr:DUF998 domain-containing protein [Methanospirillum hungatei]MCA1915846.1 DUF998 domain-containing protein [Methanospirillum hungatei]
MNTGFTVPPLKETYAGLFFLLAGSLIFMGIITAEIFYPAGYTTANSEISDLGATRPPDSISYQPSATIFNGTMILAGLLIIGGSLLLLRNKSERVFKLFHLLLGIGVLGVGLFPGNVAVIHPIFALIAFISGGLSCILSWKMTKSPLKFVFVILGGVTLLFLFLQSFFIPILGDGGTERFVAYPVVIWLIGFGGFLTGKHETPEEI